MERSAEIEERNVDNGTPLYNAAMKNIAETAKVLLERGAEIYARNVNNGKPFYHAARNNSTETANFYRNVNFVESWNLSRNTEGVIRVLMEHTENFCCI